VPLRAGKEYPEKGVAFANGTHSVVLNDGFWRTCSALTWGPESTTVAGAALTECLVRRSRRPGPERQPWARTRLAWVDRRRIGRSGVSHADRPTFVQNVVGGR